MAKKNRLTQHTDFSVGPGKSLIISLSSIIGLNRIVIQNKKGVIFVRAYGHSRFEFRNKKDKKLGPGACDFWLANPSTSVALQDYLEGRFWRQFNLGELFRYQKNAKLIKKLKKEIQKLVDEFENQAAEKLNGILKNHDKINRFRRN
ncbi:MAG: hypothetical protein PHT40_01850 [Patescibacteria group bacterium]|nr:hypothetical protein [Patescibacteria group bacterium]